MPSIAGFLEAFYYVRKINCRFMQEDVKFRKEVKSVTLSLIQYTCTHSRPGLSLY